MFKRIARLRFIILVAGMLLPTSGYALQRPPDQPRDIVIEGHPEPPIKAAFAESRRKITVQQVPSKTQLKATRIWIDLTRGTVYITSFRR